MTHSFVKEILDEIEAIIVAIFVAAVSVSR